MVKHLKFYLVHKNAMKYEHSSSLYSSEQRTKIQTFFPHRLILDLDTYHDLSQELDYEQTVISSPKNKGCSHAVFTKSHGS